jgi:hypothetical protein
MCFVCVCVCVCVCRRNGFGSYTIWCSQVLGVSYRDFGLVEQLVSRSKIISVYKAQPIIFGSVIFGMEDSTYLEDYIASIEFLPNDLRRDFELMREHDKDGTDVLRELYDCEQNFIQRAVRIVGENSYETNLEETTAKLNEINSLRQRAKQKMAQKVHLSSNMLKDLEKFIRKLDSDLTVFESELRTCGEFEQLSRGVEPGSDVSAQVIVFDISGSRLCVYVLSGCDQDKFCGNGDHFGQSDMLSCGSWHVRYCRYRQQQEILPAGVASGHVEPD